MMGTKKVTKTRLPEFLQYVEIDSGDIEKCSKMLSNWLHLHSIISKLKATHHSLELLRRLMVVEYLREGGARMDIIVRLHGRFQRLRYDVERVEIGKAQ